MEDLDVDELKDLLKKQALLNADTNKVVHSMRRGQRMKSLLSILWWLLIFGASAYAYFTYVEPYVEQVMGLYDSAQGFNEQARGFFGQYFGTSTPR